MLLCRAALMAAQYRRDDDEKVAVHPVSAMEDLWPTPGALGQTTSIHHFVNALNKSLARRLSLMSVTNWALSGPRMRMPKSAPWRSKLGSAKTWFAI